MHVLGILRKDLGEFLVTLYVYLTLTHLVLRVLALEVTAEENPFRVTVGLPFAVDAIATILTVMLVSVWISGPQCITTRTTISVTIFLKMGLGYSDASLLSLCEVAVLLVDILKI